MEWIPIDRENLPEMEVLVTVFPLDGAWCGDSTMVSWFGYLYSDDKGPLVWTKHGTAVYPTHYFDPKTLKIPQNQSLD